MTAGIDPEDTCLDLAVENGLTLKQFVVSNNNEGYGTPCARSKRKAAKAGNGAIDAYCKPSGAGGCKRWVVRRALASHHLRRRPPSPCVHAARCCTGPGRTAGVLCVADVQDW